MIPELRSASSREMTPLTAGVKGAAQGTAMVASLSTWRPRLEHTERYTSCCVLPSEAHACLACVNDREMERSGFPGADIWRLVVH